MADRNASVADKNGRGPGSAAEGSGLKQEDDKAAAVRERDSKDDTPPKVPKKRRKVNHACVYCRRSHMTCDLERPCTRCIKRNIGHLCHDEPRESDAKKPKGASEQQGVATTEAPSDAQSEVGRDSISSSTMGPPPSFDGSRPRTSSGFGAGLLAQSNPLNLVGQAGAGMRGNAMGNGAGSNASQFAGFSDAWMTAQNFQDMNNFNPGYTITPEVSSEFNLINDFLHTNLLDENRGIAPEDLQQNTAFANALKQDAMLGFDSNNSMSGSDNNNGQSGSTSMPPPPNVEGKFIPRPGSAAPADKDKTREYYLQAADPSGNDNNPEERMARVLQAKYDAGLLKPFNYIKGYARLGKYLDGHIAASSKQKILRTINQFRPKFREKAQGLTDLKLVYVEMWFERQLMEYDRVFASMAVPACCWRRTGEIFRGNKEMAELINVPVNQLRDGKIALHEILTEESMVRYWEEFGTIAFDPAHDTLLTACALKNPSDTSSHPIVKCCFSFTIRRDDHKLPSLIVGNFLPHDPTTH